MYVCAHTSWLIEVTEYFAIQDKYFLINVADSFVGCGGLPGSNFLFLRNSLRLTIPSQFLQLQSY